MTKRPNRASRTIRVLIADDSALLREALGRFLSALPGVAVVGLCRDGSEALELAPLVRPDVVLMDLAMPRLDGLAATRVLKSAAAAPAVVICSMEDSDELRLAARAAGADALVRKRDLAHLVERLLWTVAQ
jgi:DNA-binding NarL/FixJ family response regulator